MDRHLFVLELADLRDLLPAQLDLPSPHFGCLIAWDASGATVDAIAAFVDRLIKSGAVYFCIWGPDCERVHDVADESAARSGAAAMTTWHDKESLEETLWFFLNGTWPDGHFEQTFRAGLAISVGSSSWASTMRGALREPRTFSESVLKRKDAGT
jgi:hypothetical protein